MLEAIFCFSYLNSIDSCSPRLSVMILVSASWQSSVTKWNLLSHCFCLCLVDFYSLFYSRQTHKWTIHGLKFPASVFFLFLKMFYLDESSRSTVFPILFHYTEYATCAYNGWDETDPLLYEKLVLNKRKPFRPVFELASIFHITNLYPLSTTKCLSLQEFVISGF